MEAFIVIGRVALGGLFVVAGLTHIGNMGQVREQMTRRGVVYAQPLLIAGTIFQIAAGVLLAAGLFTPFAAIGLTGFTLAATVMMLRFWEIPKGPERHVVKNAFLSNVGIVGGLLLAVATHG
jgi:putative oxidoreductase